MTYSPPPASPVPGPFVTTIGRFGLGSMLARLSPSNDISGVLWTAANRAIYAPIYLPTDFPVIKVFWINGIAVAGDVDVGLYTEAFARVFSTGAVAQAGTSQPQEVDITDVRIPGGRVYYLGMSCSSTSSRIACAATGDAQMTKMAGPLMQAAAHPLPDPATPIVTTVTSFPIIGLSQRSLI